MDALYKLTACEIVELLKSGKVSIAETLESLQARIDAVEPLVNALPTQCFERASVHAEQLQALPVEQRGRLCGLPVSIKDLTPVAGVRTVFGSRIFENHVPDVSDQLVQRIEQDGGVIYAKSNTPEFGAGGITFNDVFGMTRNPHNTACASGGSSGGAAASLASGCAWLSQGSDMAGSLRTPAAFCGVASLRPSPGTVVSTSEFLPFDVLGADGPMARNVDDLALFADCMRVENSNRMQEAVRKPLKPARIAFSGDLGVTAVEPDIAAAFRSFVDQLANLGWNLTESHPDLGDVHRVFDVLRAQNFAVALEGSLNEFPGIMKPELVWNIEQGLNPAPADIREALREQGRIVNRSARFMDDFDVLVCPATSVVSVQAEQRYPGATEGVPVSDYYRWLAVAYASTVTTLPVITIYSGQSVNGLPVGVQLIGKSAGEALLFQYAKEIERVVGNIGLPVDPSAAGH